MRPRRGLWSLSAALGFTVACSAPSAPASVAPEQGEGPSQDLNQPRADDVNDQAVGDEPDLAVVRAPDFAPLPADSGAIPDIALPTPVGLPSLRIAPSTLRLKEGGPPSIIVVALDGEVNGQVQVQLEAAGLRFDADRITLDDAHRTVEVKVDAPFDLDEDNLRGVLTATSFDVEPARLPFAVVDAQLTLSLLFDAEEDDFARNGNDKARRLNVETRIGDAPGPNAVINLRGKGTLGCARRSFTVRLATPIRVIDSPAMTDVLLLSLCEDQSALKSRASLTILQRLGLFPAWFSFIELRFGDETRGVYLMVERPRTAIARVFPDNTLILRRVWDADAEIDRPDADEIADPAALLAPYASLYSLPAEHEGPALLDALRRRMDYDQYLLLLAYNSLLENGDYIDELFVYDLPSPDLEHAFSPYFGVMAWDQDEIFKNCHSTPRVVDPLTYCAESALDALVVHNDSVRAVYLAQLERLMDGPLSVGAFTMVVDRAAADLSMYLARPGVLVQNTLVDNPPPNPALDRGLLIERLAQRQLAVRAAWP